MANVVDEAEGVAEEELERVLYLADQDLRDDPGNTLLRGLILAARTAVQGDTDVSPYPTRLEALRGLRASLIASLTPSIPERVGENLRNALANGYFPGIDSMQAETIAVELLDASDLEQLEPADLIPAVEAWLAKRKGEDHVRPNDAAV